MTENKALGLNAGRPCWMTRTMATRMLTGSPGCTERCIPETLGAKIRKMLSVEWSLS